MSVSNRQRKLPYRYINLQLGGIYNGSERKYLHCGKPFREKGCGWVGYFVPYNGFPHWKCVSSTTFPRDLSVQKKCLACPAPDDDPAYSTLRNYANHPRFQDLRKR